MSFFLRTFLIGKLRQFQTAVIITFADLPCIDSFSLTNVRKALACSFDMVKLLFSWDRDLMRPW